MCGIASLPTKSAGGPTPHNKLFKVCRNAHLHLPGILLYPGFESALNVIASASPRPIGFWRCALMVVEQKQIPQGQSLEFVGIGDVRFVTELRAHFMGCLSSPHRHNLGPVQKRLLVPHNTSRDNVSQFLALRVGIILLVRPDTPGLHDCTLLTT
jgi:hypothetical protein